MRQQYLNPIRPKSKTEENRTDLRPPVINVLLELKIKNINNLYGSQYGRPKKSPNPSVLCLAKPLPLIKNKIYLQNILFGTYFDIVFEL